jgi:hypothetical protein
MATSNTQLRLSLLEAEVEKLKTQLAQIQPTTAPQPWWRKIAGTFANDPAHAEAMELGRKYRESLRPPTKARRKSVKKSK